MKIDTVMYEVERRKFIQILLILPTSPFLPKKVFRVLMFISTVIIYEIV